MINEKMFARTSKLSRHVQAAIDLHVSIEQPRIGSSYPVYGATGRSRNSKYSIAEANRQQIAPVGCEKPPRARTSALAEDAGAGCARICIQVQANQGSWSRRGHLPHY